MVLGMVGQPSTSRYGLGRSVGLGYCVDWALAGAANVARTKAPASRTNPDRPARVMLASRKCMGFLYKRGADVSCPPIRLRGTVPKARLSWHWPKKNQQIHGEKHAQFASPPGHSTWGFRVVDSLASPRRRTELRSRHPGDAEQSRSRRLAHGQPNL